MATKRFKHSPIRAQPPLKAPYEYSNHITEDHKQPIYDIRFCPYFDENIFAVASAAQVTVYQCIEKEKQIRPRVVFSADKEKGEQFFAVNWIFHKNNDHRNIYLVLGNNHGIIRTVDPFSNEEKKTVCTLIGHTDAINQISVHPIFPSILASASGDSSIRIWHCRFKTAFAVVLGHTDQVISVDFHKTGEYLVSGSMDHYIRVWNIGASEELTTKIELARNNISFINKAVEIPNCNAMTSEIHSNYVDCVEFIGAYIISKDSNGYIAIWKFGEFNDPSPAGTPTSSESPTTYTSLLSQLEIPNCNQWFIRFGIINRTDEKWIACGNLRKMITIWNLSLLPLSTTNQHQITHPTFPYIIHKIDFNSNGKIMIVVGSDGRICQCDRTVIG